MIAVNIDDLLELREQLDKVIALCKIINIRAETAKKEFLALGLTDEQTIKLIELWERR